MLICQCVVISVSELQKSAKEYSLLLQTEPYWVTEQRCVFLLADCAIELQEAELTNNTIKHLHLSTTAPSNHQAFQSAYTALANITNLPQPSELKMDMVVYMTGGIENTRAELAQEPLALSPRKTITLGEQGSELSFYNLQTLTLELAEKKKLASDKEIFWGLGFRCEDIDSYHAYLTQQGVEVSAIRTGMKRNTLVASIKNHHLGLPTLLVGPATS